MSQMKTITSVLNILTYIIISITAIGWTTILAIMSVLICNSCGTIALMVLGQFSDICDGPQNIRKLAKGHKGYGSARSAKYQKLGQGP